MSKSELHVNNFGFIIGLMDCKLLLINSINRDQTWWIVEAKIIITFGSKLFSIAQRIRVGCRKIIAQTRWCIRAVG